MYQLIYTDPYLFKKLINEVRFTFYFHNVPTHLPTPAIVYLPELRKVIIHFLCNLTRPILVVFTLLQQQKHLCVLFTAKSAKNLYIGQTKRSLKGRMRGH